MPHAGKPCGVEGLGQSPEKAKMLSGHLYKADCPVLAAERKRAQSLCNAFNQTSPLDVKGRQRLLSSLMPACKAELVYIEPPFRCDYGIHISLGPGVFMNYNCVILDCAKVTIGANTLLAPGVQIYTAGHPVDPEERLSGRENAAPISIGANVWIGGNAIICPGVTIGDNVVVGAGAVVTRDLPENCVAAGSPAKVVRSVTPPVTDPRDVLTTWA